jgi:prepilin-type N-terminal cleavage/methylation domain-containing protein/prepilin-type processing-associated H-X9-DG protein
MIQQHPCRRRQVTRFGIRGELTAFTLVELLVVIAIVGVLVALTLPAVQMAREAGRRAECMTNQVQLALAVTRYDASKGFLPGWRNRSPRPDDNPPNAPPLNTVSWPIMLLPFIERNDVYTAWATQAEEDLCYGNNGVLDSYKPPGEGAGSTMALQLSGGPHSLPSEDTNNDWAISPARPRISVFICGSSPPKTGIVTPKGDASGHQSLLAYAANCGTGATSNVARYEGVLVDNVALPAGQRNAIDDINSADGAATTLLFAEKCGEDVRLSSPFSDTNQAGQHRWGVRQPATFTWNFSHPSLSATSGTATPSTPGFGIAATSPLAGTKVVNSGTASFTTPAVRLVNAQPSSNHPGGAVVTFCDGHSTFLRDAVRSEVYAQLVSSDNGRISSSATPAANNWRNGYDQVSDDDLK